MPSPCRSVFIVVSNCHSFNLTLAVPWPDCFQRALSWVCIAPCDSYTNSRSTRIHSQKTNVVPCSDGAGEIVAVGQDVKGWKVGDRVCPNFALDHIYGDVTEEIKNTGLGGQIDGVLREYINVPVHVCIFSTHHRIGLWTVIQVLSSHPRAPFIWRRVDASVSRSFRGTCYSKCHQMCGLDGL